MFDTYYGKKEEFKRVWKRKVNKPRNQLSYNNDN
jgi:hypothetical protein